jgi:outer membrane protein TolC
MKAKNSIRFFLLITILSASGAVLPSPSAADGTKEIPLTLHESMLMAMENNFDIQIEKSRPMIAEQDVGIASSEFDLTLFGKLDHSSSRTPSTSAFAIPDVLEIATETLSVGVKQKLKPGTSYELSLESIKTDTNSVFAGIDPEYRNQIRLSLNQPLLKGLGNEVNTTNIAIARNTKKISQSALKMKVMRVLTTVREAYWDMVYLDGELEVSKESLELARDFLERIRLQVEVGVMAPLEIANAKAIVAVREEELIGIREKIANNQDKLKALLNIKNALPGSGVNVLPLDKPETGPRVTNIESLRETAYADRPDYRQAEVDLETRERLLKKYKNDLLPSLDLKASLTLKGTRGTGRQFTDFNTGLPRTSAFAGSLGDSLGDVAKGKYYDINIGLEAAYPLSNRQARNRVAKGQLEYDITAISLRKLKQDIDVELFRALREVEAAEQTIEASRAARELAEKKLDAETRKFEVGSSTSFAVLEFQKDLAAEKSKEIKAVTDRLKAIAHLELATGAVLKNNNIEIEFMDQ